MKKTLILTAALVGIAGTAALAGVTVGEPLGTEDAVITQKLQEAGYQVTEIEREDDEIEVTATKDGQEFEIEIRADGTIEEIELED